MKPKIYERKRDRDKEGDCEEREREKNSLRKEFLTSVRIELTTLSVEVRQKGPL